MDGYSFWYKPRGVLTAAALVITLAAAPGARADEPTPAWLSAIGDFVRDGLAPPRTAEDLVREERRRAAAQSTPAPAPAPVQQPVAAPAMAAPAPEPEPVRVAMPAPAPEPVAEPAPAAAPHTSAAVAAAARPAKAVVSPAEIKPRPVVPATARAVQVPPPPEPLTGSRIAATATLDQAMRLGGPAGLYAQRVKRPQVAP